MPDLSFIYFNSTLDYCGIGSDPRLAALSERHRIGLPVPALEKCLDPVRAVTESGTDGAVLEMSRGWAGLAQIRLAHAAVNLGKRVWFYWPAESGIECIDDERLRSYRNLNLLAAPAEVVRPAAAFVSDRFIRRARAVLSFARALRPSGPASQAYLGEVQQIASAARPVRFGNPADLPSGKGTMHAVGAYLRTDYWAELQSGGSYGHTCYLAKALSRTVERLVCLTPTRYSLLTELGLEQVVLPPPGSFIGEDSLLSANAHYYPILKTALSVMRPAFIYERLCLGNYCGARLSQELSIPLVVEYNGSEIEMNRSFGGNTFQHEAVFLKAEEAAFRQATVISVVSEALRDDLVARGVDASKIIANPNGVDLDAYPWVTEERKAEVRREFGWNSAHRVIGFIGTFGGWHGIDVLAESIPRVCATQPAARFLLIGDGVNKRLVDQKVREYGLESRVVSRGHAPQREGARLLQACDIYVSPHSRTMRNGRFFGSPTKLFEYMALGGGIVASDLDQIGEVLSPAVRARDLNGLSAIPVSMERAVLCKPGSVEEFVVGVEHLVQDPEACRRLGRNARNAAAEHFSWERHVDRLWQFIRERTSARQLVRPVPKDPERIQTGDDYKDQVQNQWDNNPCGSQYVKEAEAHTLEWFIEVEAYRYGVYAPWMPETMEFAHHRGHRVLEVGGGLGTDLAQFATNGAVVTDIDLSAGHLALAQENFRLRGLQGRFIHHDAENLPFDDNTFDVVYSNGVIHHTPNTRLLVDEIHRVLKPGGRVIIMVYAENSLHYWGQQVVRLGLLGGMLRQNSIADIMSRNVEMTDNDARPLVKVYTKERLGRMFNRFSDIQIDQRQLTAPELPRILSRLSLDLAGKWMGWNLILKASKSPRL